MERGERVWQSNDQLTDETSKSCYSKIKSYFSTYPNVEKLRI